MRVRLALPVLFVLAACADQTNMEPDDGGATGTDATVGDATVIDGGVADASADAGVNADATTNADAMSADASAADAGGPNVCSGALTYAGIVFGGMGPMPRTLLPVSSSPVMVSRIEETSTFVAGAISRVSPSGFGWHAQASHLTMFDDVDYQHLFVDPATDATYAGIEIQMQRDNTALRFYGADGQLARSFERDAAAGMDLVGASRQSNFFVAKYDAMGAVDWVTRFGANGPGTDRAGSFVVAGLTPGGVRVVGTVEGATEIAIAPGSAGGLTFAAAGPFSFWAELSRASGGYVPGSFRHVGVTGDGSSSLVFLAYSAHAPNGQTGLAGILGRSSGSVTHEIGAGGPGSITVTSTVSRMFVTKLTAEGAPAYVATAEIPALRNGSPRPRAVAISPNGEVVVGGQFPGSGTEAVFHGASGSSTRITYAASESFLAAYSPTGALRWVKRIVSTNLNAVSRIVVTADAIYMMQSLGVGDVLGPGEAGETRLEVGGYHLARYALDTGDLAWARSFTDAAGRSGPAAYDVWAAGSELVVPVQFSQGVPARVVGGGLDVSVQGLSTLSLGALVFATDGTYLGCQAVADGSGGRFHTIP